MRAVFLLTLAVFCAQPQVASIHRHTVFPVVFEPEANGFVSRTPGRTLQVNASGFTVALGGKTVRTRFKEAITSATVEGLEQAGSFSNYFIGSRTEAWRTEVPHFRKLRYHNIYPGIDVVYYGNHGALEYDFVVAPGANASDIQLDFDGAERVALDRSGDLLLTASSRTIRQHRPKVYQVLSGIRREIPADYQLRNGIVRLVIGTYDKTQPLTIDPVLSFASYFGGEGQDAASATATDADGSIYVTGSTNTVTFPARSDAPQQSPGGATDVFVAKFSQFGDLTWVTYFGGRGTEAGLGLALDSAGNVHVSGFTTSNNLPVKDAYQSIFNGGELDAFLVKISSGGNQLLYATYLGGSGDDYGNGVAVDPAGNAYVTGWTRSSNFPSRGSNQQGPAGSGSDTFVTKFAPSGTVTYSTFVGGNGDDLATGIAVDAAGSAYVTGGTLSTVFPGPVNVVRSAGGYDAFLYKLTPAGNSLAYSTLIGGSAEDFGQRVALDPLGGAYVTGYTRSSDFLTTPGTAQRVSAGGVDSFVVKMTPAGDAVAYATLLGGNGDDYGYGIAVDNAGTAYVCGWTNSTNFPSRNAAQQGFGGGRNDGYVARLTPSGDSLLYSTYIGGSGEDKIYGLALDRSGAVTIAGQTDSTNLPRATNSLSSSTLKTADVFLGKLSADAAISILTATPLGLSFESKIGGPVPQPQSISLTSTGQPLSYVATTSAPWLRITPAAGVTGSPLSISVVPTGLQAGVYKSEVVFTAAGSPGAAPRVAVTLTVSIDPPVILQSGILNGASFQFGPVAPGELVTIYGTGFGTQADTRVLVDGAPIPVLYVGAGQINAIVPYVAAGRRTVDFQVEMGGRKSASINIPVAAAAPGIFNTGGAAIAFNQDNRPNNASNPANRGDIVVFFATGEGVLSPAVLEGVLVNGTAKPVLPVGVRIGGLDSEILYAGTIPGLIPGVMQLNVRIPAGAPSGLLSTVVNVGGVSSNQTTIAVR